MGNKWILAAIGIIIFFLMLYTEAPKKIGEYVWEKAKEIKTNLNQERKTHEQKK